MGISAHQDVRDRDVAVGVLPCLPLEITIARLGAVRKAAAVVLIAQQLVGVFNGQHASGTAGPPRGALFRIRINMVNV